MGRDGMAQIGSASHTFPRLPSAQANLKITDPLLIFDQARVQYQKDLKSGKNRGMATMAWESFSFELTNCLAG